MHSINKAARDALGLKHGKTGGEGVGGLSCKGFLAGHLPKSWGLPVQKHLDFSISVPLCKAPAAVGYRYCGTGQELRSVNRLLCFQEPCAACVSRRK